ncbi:MAG TPA: hypothetical protein VLV83_22345 [Acidobacteriota bacterium]|nr:hypothetical protein [Acidobacteriota bacterium]
MDTETLNLLLVIFAAGCALALVLQALLLLQTSRAMKRLAGRLEARSRKLEGDVEELTGKLSEVVDNLKPLSELSDNLSDNLAEISDRLTQRTKDFNDFTEELLQIGRKQASKLDYVVTDTVEKFEQTTEVIQRDILRPTAEITALIKGLRSGLAYLFNRGRQDEPDLSGQEEELFI